MIWYSELCGHMVAESVGYCTVKGCEHYGVLLSASQQSRFRTKTPQSEIEYTHKLRMLTRRGRFWLSIVVGFGSAVIGGHAFAAWWLDDIEHFLVRAFFTLIAFGFFAAALGGELLLYAAQGAFGHKRESSIEDMKGDAAMAMGRGDGTGQAVIHARLLAIAFIHSGWYGKLILFVLLLTSGFLFADVHSLGRYLCWW